LLLNIVIVLLVSGILVVEIRTRGMVTEAFVTACALVVVAVGMLEVDIAVGNHYDIFCNGRDR